MTYTQRRKTQHLPTRASVKGKGLTTVDAIEDAYNTAAHEYVQGIADMNECISEGYEPTDEDLDALQALANKAGAYDRVMKALNVLVADGQA